MKLPEIIVFYLLNYLGNGVKPVGNMTIPSAWNPSNPSVFSNERRVLQWRLDPKDGWEVRRQFALMMMMMTMMMFTIKPQDSRSGGRYHAIVIFWMKQNPPCQKEEEKKNKETKKLPKNRVIAYTAARAMPWFWREDGNTVAAVSAAAAAIFGCSFFFFPANLSFVAPLPCSLQYLPPKYCYLATKLMIRSYCMYPWRGVNNIGICTRCNCRGAGQSMISDFRTTVFSPSMCSLQAWNTT